MRVGGGFVNNFPLNPRIIPVLLALLCTDMAYAQDRGSAGQGKIYVGGAVGRGGFDTSYEQTKSVIRSTGATSFIVTANALDTMWKGYFGYRVSPNLSMEAGYWNFGRADISTSITAPVVTGLQRTFRADGYGVDAVLWLPAGSAWSGLVKVGAMRTTTKASAGDPGAGLTALPEESARTLNLRWGAGLEYRLAPSAAARLEFEAVNSIGDNAKFGTADVLMWTLGVNYRF